MIKSVLHAILLCTLVLGAVSCGSTLVIEDVDYSQPLESVLTPDSKNVVHDQRYAIQFSVNPILDVEEIESVNEIRLIRNSDGYYFVTAIGFQHVYVLAPRLGELELVNRIEFGQNGFGEPAFNQRTDYIELVDLSSGETYRLDHEGILEEGME